MKKRNTIITWILLFLILSAFVYIKGTHVEEDEIDIENLYFNNSYNEKYNVPSQNDE